MELSVKDVIIFLAVFSTSFDFDTAGGGKLKGVLFRLQAIP